MENPIVTNKETNLDSIPESIKSNAQIIGEQMKSVDWKFLYLILIVGIVTLLATVFSFIVTIRFAITLF